MMKKWVLGISKALIVSVAVIINIICPTYAATINFDQKINEIQAKYPNGGHWNGECEGSYQCVGFGFLMYREFYGVSRTAGANFCSKDEIRKGDYICYTGADALASVGHHAVFVLDRSGDTITVVECNVQGDPNGIRWGTTKSISAMNTVAGRHAPEGANISSNRDPYGCIDYIGIEGDKIRIKGWAIDDDTPNETIMLHVYIGDYAHPGHNGEVYAFLANSERIDVDNAYHKGKRHGVDVSFVPKRTGDQPIYVYAINSREGNNPQIGEGRVKIVKQQNKEDKKIEDKKTEDKKLEKKIEDDKEKRKTEDTKEDRNSESKKEDKKTEDKKLEKKIEDDKEERKTEDIKEEKNAESKIEEKKVENDKENEKKENKVEDKKEEWVWSDWSAWSDWSTTPVTENETRNVETRQVSDNNGYVIETYYYWKDPARLDFSSYDHGGWEKTELSFDSRDNGPKLSPWKEEEGAMTYAFRPGIWDWGHKYASELFWFESREEHPATTHTEYHYRERTKVLK